MACESCGFVPEHERQLEIHHIDQDRSNNDPANLQTLCSNCHSLIHAAAPKRLASSEQLRVLAQLRALKRRRNAAAREEKYRLRDMARQFDDLVRMGESAGLQADEMYLAAGIKDAHRFEPGRVQVSHSSPQPGVRDDLAARHSSPPPSVCNDLAAQLKALGEPARLAIIERLSGLEESAVEPFCDYLQLSQPTVSHHLKVLRQAGVIEVAGSSGPSTFYRLVPETIKEVVTRLAALCDQASVSRAA